MKNNQNQSHESLGTNGILVGCDEAQEWLLPWWWKNYSSFNQFPVSFVDLGLSEEGRKWCEDRGELLYCHAEKRPASKEEINPKVASRWEEIYGEDLWKSRQSWFQKPLCMLQSPYERTIWLDLDCEVLGSLHDLFSYCECKAGLGMAQEPHSSQLQEMAKGLLLPNEVLFNSGVIVFSKGSSLVKKWANEAQKKSAEFWGDGHLLSRLIHIEKYDIQVLPDVYNWRMSQGIHLSASIVHWVGSWGKEYIKKHGGIRKDLENFFESINSVPGSDL